MEVGDSYIGRKRGSGRFAPVPFSSDEHYLAAWRYSVRARPVRIISLTFFLKPSEWWIVSPATGGRYTMEFKTKAALTEWANDQPLAERWSPFAWLRFTLYSTTQRRSWSAAPWWKKAWLGYHRSENTPLIC